MKSTSIRQRFITKLNPAQILILTFVVVIAVGTFLLMLPISNLNEVRLIDHLFVATTSTCVTGLVPYAISEQYTLFGKLVILLLIQIGGLGLMSIMALIMTMAHVPMTFKEKGLLMDAINRTTRKDLMKFLKSIFIYTFFFEGLGTLFLSMRFVPMFGIAEGFFQSLFLSVSAFCNAGMDLLGANSLLPYANDVLVNLTVAALIITGGLGFAVWFDLKSQWKNRKVQKWSLRFRKLSVHTKLVLIVSLGLLFVGSLLFLVLEYHNPDTIAGMSFSEKLLVSFFQSTTLRTAGFASINIGACRPATQFLMLFFMLIGGSPGGTAGGIKTTTFVILLLVIHRHLTNEHHSLIMKRSISNSTFEKAYLITITYAMILILGIFLLLISEGKDLLMISFEVFSALATVGLTCGLTPLLSLFGKCVIIVLMFIGRVGPATVLLSLKHKQHKNASGIQVPGAEILIG